MKTDLPRPPIGRIAREFGRHARVASLSAGAILVGTAVSGFGPVVVGMGIDRGVVGRRGGWVAGAFAIYVVLSVLQVLSTFVETRATGRFAEDYMVDLRGRLLEHLFFLDLDFFTRVRSGRVISRLTSDVENIQQFVRSGLNLVLQATLVLVITIVMMFTRSVELSVAALMIVPPLAIATLWYRRRAYAAQLNVRDRVSDMFTRLNESLIGMRVVQAYNVEDEQREAFADVNRDTYDAKMKATRVSVTYYPLIEFLHPMAMLLVLGTGWTLVRHGLTTVGTVVAFTLFVGRLFQPIQQFTELASLLQSSSAAFAKVFAFLDERPLVADLAGARPLEEGPGAVSIEDVSFRYGERKPLVLHSIDLHVAPGERLALVGESGSGKSTLAKLLVRFYDPLDGRILVDGQDLRVVTSITLRQAIALVPQEGFLFDGTVEENIAAASPGASQGEVEGACRALGVLDRLLVLPHGLQTGVTNGGLSLSAGQRQLVALARAFLARPRVIVLDEATSNLDLATEAVVEGALVTLLEDRTSIIIAHRTRTALRADRVVLMSRGRIEEMGRPDELLEAGGSFARWVRMAQEATVGHAHSPAP